MRCALALFVAALSAAPLFASSARAQPAADAAFEEGRLDEAAARYGRAWESGELEPDALVHVHLRLAELAALASLDAEAERHLAAALALRPDAALSERAPPALAERLEALRPDARARVVLGVSGPGDPVELEVRDAPEGMVRTLLLRGSADFVRALPWDGEPRVIRPPAEAHPLEARALDRHGNTIAVVGELVPSPTVGPPSPEPDVDLTPDPPPAEDGDDDEDEDGDGLVESPWLWIAVGLVVVGVGVAIGVSASGEQFVVGAPVIR